MRQQLGFVLQLAVLSMLPLVIIWELKFRLPLIWMPVLTVFAVLMFTMGTRLREG